MAGRPLSDIDSGVNEHLSGFARDLRALRRQAGDPTLESMARKAGLSRSVLSEAMSGKKMPSETVLTAFVRQCGASESEIATWLERRRDVLGRIESGQLTDGARARRAQGGAAWRWVAAIAGVLVLVAAAGFTGYRMGQSSAQALPSTGRQYEPVRTGADPDRAGCNQDSKIGAYITEPDGTILELLWSSKCQANWGRITRSDSKVAGNTLSVKVEGKFDNAPEPQTATATDQQSTYTPIIITGSDKKACATGSIITDGKEYVLPEPACA